MVAAAKHRLHDRNGHGKHQRQQTKLLSNLLHNNSSSSQA
jgi:hypothetical protein